jgi:hypothetical protein
MTLGIARFDNVLQLCKDQEEWRNSACEVVYYRQARSIVHINKTKDRAEIDYVAGWIELSLCRIAVAHAYQVVALQ